MIIHDTITCQRTYLRGARRGRQVQTILALCGRACLFLQSIYLQSIYLSSYVYYISGDGAGSQWNRPDLYGRKIRIDIPAFQGSAFFHAVAFARMLRVAARGASLLF
jgi:hypothetical protein